MIAKRKEDNEKDNEEHAEIFYKPAPRYEKKQDCLKETMEKGQERG